MKENINEIITKILSGESTPQDNLDLINWLNRNQENIDEFNGKERVWNAINVVFAKEKYDDKTAYNKFINDINRPQRKYSNNSGVKRFLTRTLQWAAIGLILIGFGALVFHIISDQVSRLEADNYEVIVPVGSRSNLILTDGTSVWLNAGSRLSYSKNFGENDRLVHLEGEAYFDVTSNPSNPFIVRTMHLDVKAFGTVFNVKAYSDEDVTETLLVSGRVEVSVVDRSIKAEPVLLSQNQMISFSHSKGATVILPTEPEVEEFEIEKSDVELATKPSLSITSVQDTDDYTSWKDGRLVFRSESLKNLSRKLERFYNVNIYLEDESIKELKFTGIMEEVTIEEVLRAIASDSRISYVIDKNRITISR